MTTDAWSTPEAIIDTLRRRWDRGQYLRARARGEAWQPVVIPLKGPRADDLLTAPSVAADWAGRMRRASADRQGRERFTIECRTVTNRVLGENQVPARLRVDTFEQLAELLGATADVDRFDRALAATRVLLPAADAWVADHPIDVIALHDVWEQLLAVAVWIVDNDPSSIDLRHVDVPAVDTKFVERHRKLLGRLLDAALPVGRIDPTSSDFARRYGFRPRPRYVRLRLLAPVPTFPAQVTEVELRADELADTALPVTTVFIIENKASYLALPNLSHSIAVFGEGFGVTTVELVPWIADREVVYWGDIDTHGFAILDRLRERVPGTRSILMDRTTLLAHRNQVTTEPTPTSATLTHLTDVEAELYRDLVEDRYGPSVRLEQERIRFSVVRDALERWTR